MGARTINWAVEAPLVYREARGQLALFCALVALRKAESGPPGNDFGVLSIASVDTFDEELATAARSLRNHVERCRVKGLRVYDPLTGLFSEEFLRDFSSRWAPIGVSNDPRGLNAHHADNLVTLAGSVARQMAALAGEIRL